MPFLVCRHVDKRTEWKAAVLEDSFTLGFSEAATVALCDPTLGAKEVLIARQGDRYLIRDLAERDRVRLNGAVTRESLLTDGDDLQIGRIAIRFYEELPREGMQVVARQRLDLGSGALSLASRSDGSSRGAAETGDAGPPPPAPGARARALGILGCALFLGLLLGYYGQGGASSRAPSPKGPGTPSPTVQPAPGTPQQSVRSQPGEAPPRVAEAPDPAAPPKVEAKEATKTPSAPRTVQETPSAPRTVQETPPRPGPEGKTPPPAGAPSADPAASLEPAVQKAATASSSGPVPAVKPEDGSSLDALRRQLQGGAPPAPAASGAAEQPSAPGTKKLLEAALEEPAVARRRLFRLFLDVVGRTPTREEEREISTLPPAQRWPVLMRATPVRQPWLDSLRDASRALLGRDLTPDESREVGALVTRELPAAFWVSLLPAYAGTESRRPRSPQQRAASLIVDLTDRVPTSTEIEVVLVALRAQGSEADVARTLAYSPRSHLSGGGAVTPLEEEVFRFLLRSPAEAENARILEVLGGIPEAERRRWLLLTLASLPEYQTY